MPPKYLRRLISVPTVVVILLVLVATLPIWLPITALIDLVIGQRRMRYSRLGLVMILLAVNELTTVGMAFGLWLRSGVGTTIWKPKGQARMQVLMRYYGSGLVNSTRRVLGVRLVVNGLDEALAAGGPVLVLGHHTSLLDSAIPVLLLGEKGYGLRYVIKDTLALAPAFDIGGHFLPVHFVNRSGKRTSSEMDAISDLAGGLHGNEAFVLFPEGSFYNKRRHERSIERLRTDAPHLVERAEKLRHTLPPRAGGALALLAGAPEADVVMMAHTGLEWFNSLPNIIHHVPLTAPVHIVFWRVPRSEVPTDAGGQYDWLFEQFERVDRIAIGDLDDLDGPT